MARAVNAFYAIFVSGLFVALTWTFSTHPPAPSEPLSIALGWVGLISMLAMLIYVPARRSRFLRKLAPLSMWLNFHIFLGVVGVVCVFFHSLHIFTRVWPTYWANPANINFFAVLIVFFSGIFGRYLFSMLPRTRRGERMRLEEVEAELQEMDTLSGHELGSEAQRVLKRQTYLRRRLTLLTGAQRFFRWWIVLHRPLSAIMYILSVVHVILTYMFTSSLATAS
ncbi:MAG: hypothetical protein AAFZ18_30090 [Myxococcota bacterium]